MQVQELYPSWRYGAAFIKEFRLALVGARLFAFHPSCSRGGHLFVAEITSDVSVLARLLVRKPSPSIYPTRLSASTSTYFDLCAYTEIHGYVYTCTHPCILRAAVPADPCHWKQSSSRWREFFLRKSTDERSQSICC